MDTKKLYDYIHENFEYKEGELYYKIRTANCIQIGQKAGGIKENRYYAIRIKGKNYFTHRLIFLYHNGHLPEFIDHIDRNKLNNNIENLREVTKSENHMNIAKYKTNKSGFKGVSWSRGAKKWQAQIQINCKKIRLGYFTTPELAYEAYCNYCKNNLTIYCLEQSHG
jgi:hypothetical protein